MEKVEAGCAADGGILTIDLDALCDNYRLLVARAAPARCAAVVKADAYGLGADRAAPALEGAGCRDFFVAHLIEGLSLRRILRADARIYVLNGLQPGAEACCADADIIPVMNAPEQIDAWVAHARAIGRRLPAALQFDTGMARLGLSPDEAEQLLAQPDRLDGIDLCLIMSHLACGDEADLPANREQCDRFNAFCAAYPGTDRALANSAGIFLGADFHNQLVRPGVALYGVGPIAGQPNPMKPVVRLDARVIQVRAIPAGTPVGYGHSFRSQEPMRLATIAVGYADGWPRYLSNRGAAYFGETRLPIVGRVSMDSIILDISALPEGVLRHGSLVELIGPHQPLEQVAADCGTIAYEVLTSLGNRYTRHYRGPAV